MSEREEADLDAIINEFQHNFYDAARMIAALRSQLDAVTKERGELRQRVQQAEKAARTTIDDCRRQGVSLGRSLANYACKMERHRAERMERVFAAAEDLISHQGTAREYHYYDALVAEVTMERLASSVDSKGRTLNATRTGDL